MDVRELDCKARIPSTRAFGNLAGDVSSILDGHAETSRANHGAIGAVHAAIADIGPTRMFVIALKQFLDVTCVDLASHLGGCALNHGGFISYVRRSCRIKLEGFDNINTKWRSGSCDKDVSRGILKLS